MVGQLRDIAPLRDGRIETGDGNSVYWETWGNPAGVPIVFVHGGPGSGCTPGHRNFFDPTQHHVIFFDQRGCGRSRPLAADDDSSLHSNTTQNLISDIENIRMHLEIDTWTVLGVSWGTTLGLAYAQAHPDRVSGVILVAVGLTTRREVRWITEGVGRLFAPQWERFSSFVPDDLADLPLIDAYAALLADPDPDVRLQAAREWCLWEDAHVSMAPGATPSLQHEDAGFQLNFARLVTHYWSNGAFLGETELMDNAHVLDDTPGFLIHGKYDVSSPIETPWRLSREWKSAELMVVEDSGHGGGSMLEISRDALARVTRTEGH